MKRLLLWAIMMIATLSISAQRKTDALDRGLVAIKTTNGVYCSWRIMGEEYYDVTYNLYRDGVKIAERLNVSNFTDAAGTSGSKYTVKAVVRGVEQAASKEATPWAQNYLEITPRHDGSITSTLVPNDACCADVNGDGELEILMKFDNQNEISANFPKEGNNGEYTILEVMKLDGTVLWWVNCGPNMGDFQNNEQNIVAYDWDLDGKAEAVMRLAEGSTIHLADGTTYTIGADGQNGTAWTNYRTPKTGGVEWFTHYGNEFLVYCEGSTGKPYVVTEFPLKRLENGETSLEAAWGDGYGHRSSKYFFGAPYLDGRKPSIFLARGIYTRHKMIAYDVNPDTHELTVRWRWNNNTAGSPWYGQGYHNYAVVDVDWDGRDEICFGSMVIDDNGHGLSTTGLGHGDAQHHGDFNPYIHGQEIFACNEDRPGNNYRDATTSKIYYRYVAGDDDGRSMMGNFTNDYPGCQGVSSRDPNLIGSVINNPLAGGTKDNITQNFRIYWDGDLCEETQDYSNGKNSAIGIYKYKKGRIDLLTGSMTNNDTKGTPCYQGDLFGDWREEIIARTKDNKIRIYTTTFPTEWRNYTLWHDHQYRNAMVWQMCGYNQPPHASYFLGELEGITQAPPALTTAQRMEVANGGSIGTAMNNQQVLLAETGDMTVSVADGAQPSILFVNTPSWVQGHDNNDHITYDYYTHTLTGGGFAGDMRLVKQGDGTLVLPNVTQFYTGNTDIWAGTLRFDGQMNTSPVWLNRHTTLISEGGNFSGGITADYNATIYPGGVEKKGEMYASNLTLNFGSRMVFDVYSDGFADLLQTQKLTIEKKDWQNGPQYATPVFQIVPHYVNGATSLSGLKVMIAAVNEITGAIEDITIEGLDGQKAWLSYEEGQLYLNVAATREATDVVWDGGTDGIWDFDDSENFKTQDGNSSTFVTGDAVTFNDQASATTVQVTGDLSPSSVTFDNNAKNFTLEGTGSIIGNGSLTKKGTGNVTINNVNKYTGDTNLQDGKLIVGSLANNDGAEYGALGGVSNTITLNGGTLANSQTLVASQPITIAEQGGIEVKNGTQLTLNGTISGTGKELTKTGNGTLVLNGKASYGKLTVNQGIVQGGEINAIHQYPSKVVLNGGTLKDPNDIYSYSTNNANVEVPEGKTATWTLDSRCDYKGKLTGAGTLTVNVTSVRCNMQGDWSQFEGTIKFQNTKTGSYDPSLQWNNSYGLGKATVTGTFHNDGKDVTIGTLIDKAVITGNGRTTAKHLDLSISKVKGTITSSYIEVEHTLILNGDINITVKGTLSKGNQVELWKVGSLQANNPTLNLPELPAGLYWDTSDLLKATGILRVTDVPTSINEVMDNGQWIMDNEAGAWYDLQGRRVSVPSASSASSVLPKGVYIRNGKKIIIK